MSTATAPVPRTRLLLVRHAQAYADIEGIFAGQHNCRGLSMPGRRQAALLAQRLATEQPQLRISTVYCTQVARCIETAQAVARALGVPMHADLPGPRYGEADGEPVRSIMRKLDHPHALRPDVPVAQGAESWHELADRVGGEIEELVSKHAGKTVVVVCHRQTIIAVAQHLLMMPLTQAHATFEVANTGITEWESRRLSAAGRGAKHSRWVLLRHNDIGHLAMGQTVTLGNSVPDQAVELPCTKA